MFWALVMFLFSIDFNTIVVQQQQLLLPVDYPKVNVSIGWTIMGRTDEIDLSIQRRQDAQDYIEIQRTHEWGSIYVDTVDRGHEYCYRLRAVLASGAFGTPTPEKCVSTK